MHVVHAHSLIKYARVINMAARTSLTIDSVVRGYHIYKDIWTPNIGDDFGLDFGHSGEAIKDIDLPKLEINDEIGARGYGIFLMNI